MAGVLPIRRPTAFQCPTNQMTLGEEEGRRGAGDSNTIELAGAELGQSKPDDLFQNWFELNGQEVKIC